VSKKHLERTITLNYIIMPIENSDRNLLCATMHELCVSAFIWIPGYC